MVKEMNINWGRKNLRLRIFHSIFVRHVMNNIYIIHNIVFTLQTMFYLFEK